MFSLALDYFLLVTFAAAGLLQVVAALSGLSGLQLLRNRPAAAVLGAALLCGAFTWFVLTGNPSIPGDLGGVEGSQQFGLFWGGLAAAIVGTFLLSSLARRTSRVVGGVPPAIDAFRSGTLLELLKGRRGAQPEAHDGA